MPALATRAVAKDLDVTIMGLGGTALGNMYSAVDPAAAVATVHAAFAGGIRYFDTAPIYGYGLAETRLGEALRTLPRENIVVSSKVGYDLVEVPARRGAGEHVGRRARNPPRVPLHARRRAALDRGHDAPPRPRSSRHAGDPRSRRGLDPDRPRQSACEKPLQGCDGRRLSGARRAALPGCRQSDRRRHQPVEDAGRLRERRPLRLFPPRQSLHAAGAGAAENPVPAVRSARHQDHRRRPIQFRHPGDGRRRRRAPYDYKPASAAVRDRVRRIEAVCGRHDVPLAAAALQFPLGHPLVASVIPGARSADEQSRNMDLMRRPIDADLWAELKHEGLVDQDAPTAGRRD